MLDPRAIAESLLGPIKWDSLLSGFCRCPGEFLHTARSAPRDCRVTLDRVPTVYCFHDHCKDAVLAANKELRAQLGTRQGTVLQAKAPPNVHPLPQRAPSTVLSGIYNEVLSRRDRILSQHRWTYADIFESSPVRVADYQPEDHFRHWLLLWPPDSILWIGEIYDSGKIQAATHFRPLTDWYDIGPAMGKFTCASSFRPGTTSRSDVSVLSREFLVVESDTLTKDQVGAVFRWMTARLRMDLYCIVDTGGKSLHAWFGSPPPEKEHSLKVALGALGCDTKMFNRSQPVRLPGAWRDGNLQKLVWVRK